MFKAGLSYVGVRKIPNSQYTSYQRGILSIRVFLSLELKPCSSKTCLNGGTCIDGTGAGETTTVSCVCPPRHTGQRCESKYNPGRKKAVICSKLVYNIG